MRQYLAITALFLLAAVSPGAVRAELTECDGRWTDKPCDGKVTKRLDQLPEISRTSGPAGADKETLVHDLRMKVIRARDEHGLRPDIAGIESFCGKPETPFEECSKAVADADAALSGAVHESVSTETQQRSVQLQEEANRLQEERNRIEAERPVIIFQPGDRFDDFGDIIHGGSSIHIHGESGIGIHGGSADGGVSVDVDSTSGDGGIHHRPHHRHRDDGHDHHGGGNFGPPPPVYKPPVGSKVRNYSEPFIDGHDSGHHH